MGAFVLQSGEVFVGNFDHGRINGDGCLRMRGGNVIRGRFTAPKDVTKKSVLSVDRLSITNATFTALSEKDPNEQFWKDTKRAWTQWKVCVCCEEMNTWKIHE